MFTLALPQQICKTNAISLSLPASEKVGDNITGRQKVISINHHFRLLKMLSATDTKTDIKHNGCFLGKKHPPCARFWVRGIQKSGQIQMDTCLIWSIFQKRQLCFGEVGEITGERVVQLFNSSSYRAPKSLQQELGSIHSRSLATVTPTGNFFNGGLQKDKKKKKKDNVKIIQSWWEWAVYTDYKLDDLVMNIYIYIYTFIW